VVSAVWGAFVVRLAIRRQSPAGVRAVPGAPPRAALW
jgi:hypothetical protein